ncbi:hypothetical protein Phpb_04027 [Photorhabdus namnaonensis]|uniref:Uncharacterized protein n=1 Tax=Photorhabdus namnaonensis TaxID=1851568 RepID=A0A1B8YD17_9GAMM|nr:hypothetical protein Phpb_04027 [Photorhabdus namnaonensis]
MFKKPFMVAFNILFIRLIWRSEQETGLKPAKALHRIDFVTLAYLYLYRYNEEYNEAWRINDGHNKLFSI